eukprot:1195981-Prorocentrum_minimum.AAC.2
MDTAWEYRLCNFEKLYSMAHVCGVDNSRGIVLCGLAPDTKTSCQCMCVYVCVCGACAVSLHVLLPRKDTRTSVIVTSRNECRDELRSLMVADKGLLAQYALLKVRALSARQCERFTSISEYSASQSFP